MDIRSGKFETDEAKLEKLLGEEAETGRRLVAFFEVGERVQIKGGWFEVMSIKMYKRQRIVLKPIPAPRSED